MKSITLKILNVLLSVFLLAASSPGSIFAQASAKELADLRDVQFLQTQLRDDAQRVVLDRESIMNRAQKLRCLNAIRAMRDFDSMSEEKIIEKVNQCFHDSREKQIISVGIAAFLAVWECVAAKLAFSTRLSPHAKLLVRNASLTVEFLSFGAIMVLMVFSPYEVTAGQAPGGFEYLQKLKQNPVLFEDIVQARQLLEGPLNADGSVSRYLENYKTYLQNMKSARFALQLPEIEAEYRGWAQTNGVSAEKPDMMKYMEIASRYPMSERERQMRGIRAKETLKRVQKSLREAVSKPVPGI